MYPVYPVYSTAYPTDLWPETFWTPEHPDRFSPQDTSGKYNVIRLKDPNTGMQALRELFPQGIANELNFILFSTDGSHGTRNTIEEVETNPELKWITFLVVHARWVTLRYGEVAPQTPDDFAFLRTLRDSSWRVVPQIGMPLPPETWARMGQVDDVPMPQGLVFDYKF